MHICGPAAQYAYSEDRIYTPPDALLPDYLLLAETLGLQRIVFVQPSVYGTDNTVMLAAMESCPLENRGVAVVKAQVSEAEIESLNQAGVRGVRLNLVDVTDPHAELPLQKIEQLAVKIARFDWHIELLLHVDDFPNLDKDLSDLPVEVVIGHVGYFRPGSSPDNPGFQALIRLMKSKRCWTKLTAPYRVSSESYPYADTRPFAEALIEEASERLVWGSDWPHVRISTQMPNDGELLELFLDWAGNPEIAHRILVENPARLYGF